MPLFCGACFRKGAVAGDRMFEAGELCFWLEVTGVVCDEEPAKRKKMKPRAKRAARTRVIGLVRRKDRDMAIWKAGRPDVSTAGTAGVGVPMDAQILSQCTDGPLMVYLNSERKVYIMPYGTTP